MQHKDIKRLRAGDIIRITGEAESLGTEYMAAGPADARGVNVFDGRVR